MHRQVFDAADGLSRLHPRLVPNLVALSSLTRANICPIFTCVSPSALVGDSTDPCGPVCVCVPPPTHTNMLEIIARANGAYKSPHV